VTAVAPGRVNLIGDHTDTTGGWCLPMAIDLVTVVKGERGGDCVVLRSASEPEPVSVPLDVEDPTTVEPRWGRFVAGVVCELRPRTGFAGNVRSDVPVGAGLSSSAALEVAVALALGFQGSALELARLCQRAEHRATGVPCGVMDQLASASGRAGQLLLLNCSTLAMQPIDLPKGAEVVVVHSGQSRELAGSAYADRRRELELAERIVGSLPAASLDDVELIEDEVIRRRARHVVTENDRVLRFVAALRADDLATAGAQMVASHDSLRDHFDVSTPGLDDLVARLVATEGVFGARLTGAGFGGCAVALCRPGSLSAEPGVWPVRPADGARLR
jgi:galactokinase